MTIRHVVFTDDAARGFHHVRQVEQDAARRRRLEALGETFGATSADLE